MALANRVKEQPPAQTPGPACSVGVLLATLEGEELDAFKTMLGTREAPGWSAPEIYRALTDEGYKVGFQTINRHRGGQCKCSMA